MKKLIAGLIFLGVLLAPLPASASSFKINCAYTRTLSDDPIVFPGQPGASHSHDFFGNRTTDAFSTYNSLIGQPTSCASSADTAAYWAPTLYQNGVAVHPTATAYYYDKFPTLAQPIPFPPGLKMVAGDAHAMGPQPTTVVYFGCGSSSGISGKNFLPNCTGTTGPGTLQVHVLFPDCWDQQGLERTDVVYATRGVCPAGYVRMPQLAFRLRYPIIDATQGVTLASGEWFTMHADFFNSWNQSVLATKVAAL